jgi:DNA-directed RNA polymerase specialized sigma24 family protein
MDDARRAVPGKAPRSMMEVIVDVVRKCTPPRSRKDDERLEAASRLAQSVTEGSFGAGRSDDEIERLLNVVARRDGIDRHRQWQRISEAVAAKVRKYGRPPSANDDPAAALRRRENSEALVIALCALPTPEREAVLRADWLEQSFEQIAKEMLGDGRPKRVRTAYRLAQAARRRLRTTLAPRLEVDGSGPAAFDAATLHRGLAAVALIHDLGSGEASAP